MKKIFQKKKFKLITLSLLVIGLLSLLVINIIASSVEPGSNQDPIVTKSYVDAKIEEAINNLDLSGMQENTQNENQEEQTEETVTNVVDVVYSDEDLEALQTQIEVLEEKLSDFMYVQNLEMLDVHTKINNFESEGDKFTVLQLNAGQKVILGEGTEIILRAGEADTISSEGGDLTDISAGQNLLGGTKAKSNHLLIASRDDGRGLLAKSDVVWCLVKGDYRIVN